MTIKVHATYQDGLIRPARPLNLPEGTELELNIEAAVPLERPAAESGTPPARIVSPRLAHPEQITDFQMEVREISDAGVYLHKLPPNRIVT
jgi:predicted DNA-binding antitoxin AbrB/MazE fold protein